MSSATVDAYGVGATQFEQVRIEPAQQRVRTGKLWFDRFVAAAGLLALAPVFLIVCAAIMIADGRPLFFGHERVGRGGKIFKCWKFRTMVRDAEGRLEQVLTSDPVARAEWDETQKLVNDPRILKFGGILRKLSIDELPQLWNVLRGDMSLVGPRPVTPSELIRYGSGMPYYLAVLPGLTGTWQISGRSNISFEERVEMDVNYVTSQSFRGDVGIMLKTPAVVFKRSGAC